MPWTDSSPTSRVFIQAVLNPLTASVWSTTEPTTYGANGLSSDTVDVALFNNSVSPDASAAVGSTGYNTGTWTTGNEVTDVTNWVAGGRALGSKTYSVLTAGSQTTASAVNFDAAEDDKSFAGSAKRPAPLDQISGCCAAEEVSEIGRDEWNPDRNQPAS